MRNNVECPKCLGAKEIMTPKKTRGFEYEKCTLCQGTGLVPQELEDDYILSLNEDRLETNDDW